MDPTQSTLSHAGIVIFGYQTPSANVPTSGNATYSGVGNVIGNVFEPNSSIRAVPGAPGYATLSGDSSMAVNFATGVITGALTNMTVTPNNGPTQPWNDVSINATISGITNNTFLGTTAVSSTPGNSLSFGASSTGKINGGFYGPNANEVGAIWTLYDPGPIGSVITGRTAFGGFASGKAPSDRRLKRDIVPLERAANGVQLYGFRYFNDARRFVGVMAQDLLADPRFAAAVSVRPSGLLLVDYARLGFDPASIDAMREAGETAVLAYEGMVTA